MMLSWGRTTDIEWVYSVELNQQNEIIDEVFQGASHITTDFNGQKYGTHPYLINATANCNFSDTGTSDYKLFLSPNNSMVSNHTREYLMDQNPWTYKIMAQELINENKYEENQNPTHWELSDVRNYIYIEYVSSQSGSPSNSKVSASFYNDCYKYSNTHNDPDIQFNIGNGIHRTAIELPENFDIDELEYLSFSANNDSEYTISINTINKLFYLSDNYEPIQIDISANNFPIQINSDNPEGFITINNTYEDYDCSGILNGEAYCDECNICSGGNTGNTPNKDMDDCGVCFGNNEAMDCEGTCFGSAYNDECLICDDNPNNDGEACTAGCIDINAENYNPEATIFDNSCLYSDRVFNIPGEYDKIQDGIFFASEGDTVLVEYGTYNEEIEIISKGITLIGDNTEIYANHDLFCWGQYYNDDDALNCALNYGKTVLTIKNSNNVHIEGFKINNGIGKGVDFEYFISVASDPDMFEYMMYNLISSGGISIINSSITLSDMIIYENMAKNFGAGIGAIDSNVILKNVYIDENWIVDDHGLGGAGIAINGGTTQIIDSYITRNVTGNNPYQLNGGGGILCGFDFSGNPLELNISNTTIAINEANIGAGIGALSGNINLDRVAIYSNIGDYGSAISLGEPLGLVVDTINIIITNSTIANNDGILSFGMIDNSSVIIANSILWNYGEFEFSNLPNNSILNVESHYSDIRILEPINHYNSISIEPSFAPGLELLSDSPCVDSGTDLLILDGETIINIDESDYYGSMPDMGKYEFIPDIDLGDINGDGVFNVQDIVSLVALILNNQYNYYADINQDSIVNIVDIISLVDIIINN
tara:strand:+ start:75 stop:2549 length:2475 start_codon:yes stop_codon:yes gene_type:complete